MKKVRIAISSSINAMQISFSIFLKKITSNTLNSEIMLNANETIIRIRSSVKIFNIDMASDITESALTTIQKTARRLLSSTTMISLNLPL